MGLESVNFTDGLGLGLPPNINATIPEFPADDIPETSLSTKIIVMLWFGFVFFCIWAKPDIPDQRHHWERRWPRTQQRKKEVDPEKRKEQIRVALVTQKVAGRGLANAVALGRDQRDGADREAPVPDTETGDGDSAVSEIALVDDGENECTVCLEPFCSGEEVSWSRDLRCRHVFHVDCVAEWLMKHDDCPCCRAEFITSEGALQSDKDLPGEEDGPASEEDGSASEEDGPASEEDGPASEEDGPASEEDGSALENSAIRASSGAFYIASGLISHEGSARFARVPALGGRGVGANASEEDPKPGNSNRPSRLHRLIGQISSSGRYRPIDAGHGEAGDDVSASTAGLTGSSDSFSSACSGGDIESPGIGSANGAESTATSEALYMENEPHDVELAVIPDTTGGLSLDS